MPFDRDEIDMGYFDDEKNVQTYIEMAKGYDGKALIKVLKAHLPNGAAVLELGMGPGKDCDMLRQSYRVTGSDNSSIFLERYRREHPEADLLLLDAVNIDTPCTFDCIYSNKVLHHLTTPQLRASLARQAAVLNEDGIVFHSFWHGHGQERYDDLLFLYYTENDIHNILKQHFTILDIQRYTEIEENDSLYIIGKKLARETEDEDACTTERL
jgi:cyclopropane fatty-acyl-phospholipid synthase-like methyltransferase